MEQGEERLSSIRDEYAEGVTKKFIDDSLIECLRLARKWRHDSRLDQAGSPDVEETRSPADSSLLQVR